MSSTNQLPHFQSGHLRAQWLTVLFAVGIIVDLVSMGLAFFQIGLIYGTNAGLDITEDFWTAVEAGQALIAVIYLVVFVMTAVVFLTWIYRTHKNLRAFDVSDLKFSPGWAVGSWFVPILNLIRPWEIVKEIWRASDPSVDMSNSTSWQKLPTPKTIDWWWILWIISGPISRLASSLTTNAKTLNDFANASWVSIISDGVTIVVAVLAVLVVRGIDARQEQKSRHLGQANVLREMAPATTKTMSRREILLILLIVFVVAGAIVFPALFIVGLLAEYNQQTAQPTSRPVANVDRNCYGPNEHRDTHDPDKAIAEYARAIEQDPANRDAYHGRGHAYLKKENWAAAIADYDKAIAIDPSFAGAYVGRGSAHLRAGLVDQSIADFTHAIALNPTDAYAYLNRGIAFHRKSDLDMAIADYTKAMDLADLPDAYYNRGLVYRKKSELDHAIADFARAIELDPTCTDAYDRRGVTYGDQGNYDRAIEDLTKAIELDPTYAAAYYNRGVAYDRKRNLDRAIADFSKAIELDPKDVAAYYRRGGAYIDKGDLSRAIADYTKVIDLDPQQTNAFINRGLAYYRSGDLNRAIADYTRSMELDSSDAIAYCNRGLAYQAQRAKPHAISDFQTCLRLGPDEPIRAEVEKELSELVPTLQTARAVITAAARRPAMVTETFYTNSFRWPEGPEKNEYWEGTRGVENGTYRWEAQAKQGFVARSAPQRESTYCEDLYVSVRVQRIRGPGSARYGVNLRSSTNSYYLFEISDDQTFHFTVRYDSKWYTIIRRTYTPAIRPDQVNQIAIVAQGSHFIFFINDEYVAEGDDVRITRGYTGMAIELSEGDSAVFEFDDFEVRPL